jgi:hypothetical protein
MGITFSNISPATSVYNGVDATGDKRTVLITGDVRWNSGCTGALIEPRVVFTAGHCQTNANWVFPPGIKVGSGTNSEALGVKVLKKYVASSYSPSCCERGALNDFMILILEKDLASVDKMLFASESEIRDVIIRGLEVQQFGYGGKQLVPNNPILNPNFPSMMKSKMRSNVFLQGNLEERELVSKYPYRYVQVQNSKDRNTCPGDSGGPLFYELEGVLRYIGALSGATGATCTHGVNDPIRINPYWDDKALSGYYTAFSFPDEISSAYSFLEEQLKLEKATAELKAKKEAEEAETKAAAELKAKQEAEAKAAADLKAKQEAAAKLAATKKATITCVKGKLTKKVTAVKPKCPTGYKLKK